MMSPAMIQQMMAQQGGAKQPPPQNVWTPAASAITPGMGQLPQGIQTPQGANFGPKKDMDYMKMMQMFGGK